MTGSIEDIEDINSLLEPFGMRAEVMHDGRLHAVWMGACEEPVRMMWRNGYCGVGYGISGPSVFDGVKAFLHVLFKRCNQFEFFFGKHLVRTDNPYLGCAGIDDAKVRKDLMVIPEWDVYKNCLNYL